MVLGRFNTEGPNLKSHSSLKKKNGTLSRPALKY
jgi:hypothetical protein